MIDMLSLKRELLRRVCVIEYPVTCTTATQTLCNGYMYAIATQTYKLTLRFAAHQVLVSNLLCLCCSRDLTLCHRWAVSLRQTGRRRRSKFG